MDEGYGRPITTQESRALARKPRDAAAVLSGSFADNIHYKFKSSQASKAMQASELQSPKMPARN